MPLPLRTRGGLTLSSTQQPQRVLSAAPLSMSLYSNNNLDQPALPLLRSPFTVCGLWPVQPSVHVMPVTVGRCDSSRSSITFSTDGKAIRFGAIALNPVRAVAKLHSPALMMLFHREKGRRVAGPKYYLRSEKPKAVRASKYEATANT